MVATSPRTMILKVQKNLAEGFESSLLSLVRQPEPLALHTVDEAYHSEVFFQDQFNRPN